MSSAVHTHRSQRHAAVLIGGSAAVSIVAVAIVVMVATSAAWTTQAPDVEGSWGTAALGLDQTELVEFNASNMLPGDDVSGHVTVQNVSSVDLDVRLYGDNLVADIPGGETASLAEHLDVTVGTTEGGSDVYSGTLAAFPGDFATATSGLGDLAVDADRTYYFAVTLNADTPSAYQDTDASITFVFEGQAG